MNNILTKTVKVTVKELVIGALCGAGITAGITGLFAGKFGFKLGKKSTKSYKNKYNELLEKNKKQVEGLTHELGELRKDIVKNTIELYEGKVTTPGTLQINLAKLKLDDNRKLNILDNYNKTYSDLQETYPVCWQESMQGRIKNLVSKLNNMVELVNNNDINALTLLADQIKLEEVRREAQEAFDREMEKQREQREHEMALKREETKKMDKYLEHLEDMKKMDVEMEATKTAAFAGVAKSAINTFKKNKEEE